MKKMYQVFVTLKESVDKTGNQYWGSKPGANFKSVEDAVKSIDWKKDAIKEIFIREIYIGKETKYQG